MTMASSSGAGGQAKASDGETGEPAKRLSLVRDEPNESGARLTDGSPAAAAAATAAESSGQSSDFEMDSVCTVVLGQPSGGEPAALSSDELILSARKLPPTQDEFRPESPAAAAAASIARSYVEIDLCRSASQERLASAPAPAPRTTISNRASMFSPYHQEEPFEMELEVQQRQRQGNDKQRQRQQTTSNLSQSKTNLSFSSQRMRDYFHSFKGHSRDTQNLYQFFKSTRTELVACLLFALISSHALIVCRTSQLIESPPASPVWVHLSSGLVNCLTVASLTQVFGHISGCHLSPSVSLALFVKGHIGRARLLAYLAAQSIGPLLGIGLLALLTSSQLPSGGGGGAGTGHLQLVAGGPSLTSQPLSGSTAPVAAAAAAAASESPRTRRRKRDDLDDINLNDIQGSETILLSIMEQQQQRQQQPGETTAAAAVAPAMAKAMAMAMASVANASDEDEPGGQKTITSSPAPEPIAAGTFASTQASGTYLAPSGERPPSPPPPPPPAAALGIGNRTANNAANDESRVSGAIEGAPDSRPSTEPQPQPLPLPSPPPPPPRHQDGQNRARNSSLVNEQQQPPPPPPLSKLKRAKRNRHNIKQEGAAAGRDGRDDSAGSRAQAANAAAAAARNETGALDTDQRRRQRQWQWQPPLAWGSGEPPAWLNMLSFALPEPIMSADSIRQCSEQQQQQPMGTQAAFLLNCLAPSNGSQMFVFQLLATCLVVLVYLVNVDPRRADAGFKALSIGLGHFVAAALTIHSGGFIANPFQLLALAWLAPPPSSLAAFVPATASIGASGSGNWRNEWWIYLITPLIGGLFGAISHEYIDFTSVKNRHRHLHLRRSFHSLLEELPPPPAGDATGANTALPSPRRRPFDSAADSSAASSVSTQLEPAPHSASIERRQQQQQQQFHWSRKLEAPAAASYSRQLTREQRRLKAAAAGASAGQQQPQRPPPPPAQSQCSLDAGQLEGGGQTVAAGDRQAPLKVAARRRPSQPLPVAAARRASDYDANFLISSLSSSVASSSSSSSPSSCEVADCKSSAPAKQQQPQPPALASCCSRNHRQMQTTMSSTSVM